MTTRLRRGHATHNAQAIMKTRGAPSRVVGIAALHVVAITAAALAVATGVTMPGSAAKASPRAQASTLSQHCRRYEPTLSNVDGDCYNLSLTMSGSGYYQTPSTAIRIDNQIELGANRDWEVWYLNTTIVNYGYGTYGYNLDSNGAYRAADCEMTGSNTTGNCETDYSSSP